MDEVRNELTAFLRFGCGGGIFILSFLLVSQPIDQIWLKVDAGLVAALISVAVVLGAFLYTFHRALVYPVMLHLFHRRLAESDDDELKAKGCFYRISDLEAELNQERWKRRQKCAQFQRSLDVWGSESHFLYVASLAMVFAAALSAHSRPYYHCGAYISILILAALSFLAAAVHDKRCIQMDLILRCDAKKEGKGSTCPE